ncbi:MAG: hypothetical protein WCQ50_17275 [Spirochaetota bacterium]
MKKHGALLLLASMFLGSLAWGQADQPTQTFKAGLNLGTEVLMTGSGSTPESWTIMGFQPDLAFGKFGVGVNLTFHFQIYPDPVRYNNEPFVLWTGDWVPTNTSPTFTDWLALYIPKLMYVRYGLKGTDPLFVKVGSIPDFTLGNGFVMGNFSNMSNFPQTRISGVDFGLDGTMFDFPYLGMELVVDNLARFDVVGIHLLGRPLVFMDNPILKGLSVGTSVVTDLNPGLYGTTKPASVTVMGVDALMPLFSSPVASLAGFLEGSIEPKSRTGFMIGAGGKLLGIFSYGTQLRILSPGFIPTYFDASYDLNREAKATIVSSAALASEKAVLGWLASIGTNLLGDKLVANVTLDGPFSGDPTATAQAAWPHLRGVARLADGLLPGVFADATYEKYYIGKVKGFFPDLIDPTDAIAGMNINYTTGGTVLTLMYNAKWVDANGIPEKTDWKVSSSIQAAIKF